MGNPGAASAALVEGLAGANTDGNFENEGNHTNEGLSISQRLQLP